MRNAHAQGPARAWSKCKVLLKLRIPVLAVMICLPSLNGWTQAGNVSPSTIYRLNPDTTFEQGCFAPCECPVMIGGKVSGTFVLTPTGFDGLFDTYAVDDVSWTVSTFDTNRLVTGKGTYKIGGEFALEQELSLYLQIDNGSVGHFDSGLVPISVPFPDIQATISTNGQFCFDTVFGVSASPVNLTMFCSGPNIILLWPANAPGVVLQSSAELGPSAVWTNCPAPVIANGQCAVTNPMCGTQQFFRLSK